MEKLLEQAQILVKDLGAANTIVNEKIAEANQTAAKNRAFKTELDEKATDLHSREIELESQESAHKALAQVKAIQEGNIVETQRLVDERQSLESDKARQYEENRIAVEEANKLKEMYTRGAEENKIQADKLKEKLAKLKDIGV